MTVWTLKVNKLLLLFLWAFWQTTFLTYIQLYHCFRAFFGWSMYLNQDMEWTHQVQSNSRLIRDIWNMTAVTFLNHWPTVYTSCWCRTDAIIKMPCNRFIYMYVAFITLYPKPWLLSQIYNLGWLYLYTLQLGTLT